MESNIVPEYLVKVKHISKLMDSTRRTKCWVCDKYEQTIKHVIDVCENIERRIKRKKPINVMAENKFIWNVRVGELREKKIYNKRYLIIKIKI